MKRTYGYRWFRRKDAPSRRAASQQRTFRPRVEVLEQRRLLAGLLQGMTIDLAAVPDQGLAGEVTVDEITFLGIAHTQIVDTGATPGVPDVGETIQADALQRVTAFVSDGTNVLPPLAWGMEMTFDLSVSAAITAWDGSNISYSLLEAGQGGTDGLLDVYVDNVMDIGDGSEQANTHLIPGGGIGGSGFQDGTQIAQFRVRAGDGGVLSGATLDGSIDATFDLVWALEGVLFDADGNDLSTTLLSAISDSNFDMDPDNGGTINSGPPSGWPASLGGPTGGGSIMDFYARQDGSVVFAVEEENGGGTEGFTPGFWKNHTEDWVGYDPTDSYADVFGVTVHEKVLKLGDKDKDGELSLLETLNLKGNSIKSFYRHSVAALLNAAHPNVDYAFNESEVIATVQNVFITGEFETIKLIFEAENELEGDINS